MSNYTVELRNAPFNHNKSVFVKLDTLSSLLYLQGKELKVKQNSSNFAGMDVLKVFVDREEKRMVYYSYSAYSSEHHISSQIYQMVKPELEIVLVP